ncbi:MAG: hypothetical protein R2819_03480 [Allomuricauda sp.]
MKGLKIISLIICLATTNVFCQDQKEEQSKLLDFVSKTGVIIKLEDYTLPSIKWSYGVAEARIRKIISGTEAKLFYQILNKDKYDTKTASIAYEDLLETQKALVTLKSQSENDLSTNSDYVENKFVTDDGFQVGYYVSKGKLMWYLKLEKYGDGNTIFMKDVNSIDEAFDQAKNKMDELK